MKKFISLMMTLIFVLTSVVSISLPMSASASQDYVEKFNANFTEWDQDKPGVTATKTFTNPSTKSNTMFITTAGTLDTHPKEYPQPSSYVEVVNKSDLAGTYPLVAADTTATAKLAKYTQNANIGMFRMRCAYPALSAQTSIRVTFKMFITDICTKGINYDTDGTTILQPVKDTAGTVKELSFSLVPKKDGSGNGTAASFKVPVNQWYTVSQVLTAKAGSNGVRLSIGTVSTASNYTSNFASTIFYDGNFKIEVLEEVAAPEEPEAPTPSDGPKEGEYTMLANVNLGDATATSTTAGSVYALYSANKVTYAASHGNHKDVSIRTDSNGVFKTVTSTLDVGLDPSTLKSAYPGIADTKVSSSGKIARLNRSGGCAMIRLKDLIDTGIFKSGDRFMLKAWVYPADVYSRGEYQSLNDGVTIPKEAQRDTNAATASIRFIYCTNTSSSNTDNIVKTYTLPVNQWTQIELSGTTVKELNAVGIRIDENTSCYGDPFTGTLFLGEIAMYHADKLPERNTNTNWKTLSNVDFESEKASVSNVAYSITSNANSGIQTLNSLVATYPQAEVGTVGLNVYKHSMNNSKDT